MISASEARDLMDHRMDAVYDVVNKKITDYAKQGFDSIQIVDTDIPYVSGLSEEKVFQNIKQKLEELGYLTRVDVHGFGWWCIYISWYKG